MVVFQKGAALESPAKEEHGVELFHEIYLPLVPFLPPHMPEDDGKDDVGNAVIVALANESEEIIQIQVSRSSSYAALATLWQSFSLFVKTHMPVALVANEEMIQNQMSLSSLVTLWRSFSCKVRSLTLNDKRTLLGAGWICCDVALVVLFIIAFGLLLEILKYQQPYPVPNIN